MNVPARCLTALLLGLTVGGLARAASAEVGRAAPDFTLTDLQGRSHSLSDYRGKTVVLEWVNPECPIVGKHYRSGNMPRTQQAALAGGVVWLQINSGHPGSQGDFTPAEVAAWEKKYGAESTAYFRDPDGRVGHLYDARTTPHMFIIDAAGTLVYEGAIDSIRSGRVEDIARATNYVSAALADIKAGRPVTTKHSQPYGCSVKYGD